MGCNVRGIKKAPQQLSVRNAERGRVHLSYGMRALRSNSLCAALYPWHAKVECGTLKVPHDRLSVKNVREPLRGANLDIQRHGCLAARFVWRKLDLDAHGFPP
jgi:hypothetical protein